MKSDSKGNYYENIPIGDENVRVTYIKNGWNEMPSVRIQIQDKHNHLRRGPEIPISIIGNVVGSVVSLLSSRSRR